MMKSLKGITCIAMAMGLSACVSTYVQPTDERAAQLTVINDSGSPLGIQGFAVAENCSGKLDLGMPGRQIIPQSSANIRIRANEPFSFFVSYMRFDAGVIRYIHLPMTFTPAQSGKFELKFSSDGVKYSAVMLQLVDGKAVPVATFRIRQWNTPFVGEGPFCT